MEVIRRYYQLIPLDPGFRILNEHEADLMRQDLLEELFEEKYGEAEGDSESRFVRFADWFSGERTDDALYRLVRRLYDFSRTILGRHIGLGKRSPASRCKIRRLLGKRHGFKAYWRMRGWP